MRHNFTQLNLLRNKEFYFTNKNEKKIFFKVPTLEDFIADDALQVFLSILNMNWKTLELSTQIDNVYQLVLFMAFHGVQTEAIAETLHKLIDNITIQTNGIFVDKEILTAEEFIFLTDCWLVAVGSKTLESLEQKTQTPVEMDEIEKRLKESEDKIRRIKQQKEPVQNTQLQLDRAVITVIKEYHFTMENVMQMNIFTLLWYYMYALKYNNYRIETLAYAGGLIKKHHYFSE